MNSLIGIQPQYATGIAQPSGLSVMNLKPIEILLPTLNEQEK